MLKYFPLGDTAFLIKIGNDISTETHFKVQYFTKLLEDKNLKGIIEVTPAYNEILISYDPDIMNYKELIGELKKLEKKEITQNKESKRILYIPVCYEAEYALDIEIVASENSISINEVVKIHTSGEYLVYMLGFTPGFCYLGGMDQKIATPRKETPRVLIEAGSVGIAGKQTGIYPIDSPGGWQIIGKTPLELFNPECEPYFFIEPGNYLKFYGISKSEFERIKQQLEQNSFVIKTEIRDE